MNNEYNKMIVTDYGICVNKFVNDEYVGDSIIITKEAFIEAYNKWIKEAENENSN